MKIKTNNTTRMGMLVALTAITAMCMAPRVRAGGGPFYPTVTNVTQLIADINYANTSGGTFTINLQPNTTFDLITVNGVDEFNSADLLPIIGATNAVNLTILGNGDTIQRDATTYEIRLLEVAKGSSLTLDQMTLTNGYCYAHNGGAIYNFGTLVISNCTLSGNISYYSGYESDLLGGEGGAIYNNGGTVIISDSVLSGNFAYGNGYSYGGAIYNDSGTVTISNSTISGNFALGDGGGIYNHSGTVTVSHSTISSNSASYSDGDGDAYGDGGGIYNNGTVTVENSSSITGNVAVDFGPDVYNLGTLYLDGTSTIGILDGNSAIPLYDSVGDGIPDWWRLQYFGGTGGSTNAQSCAACDADGTGQNNLFKYVAGLDPTNPAAVFTLKIASVNGQPSQKNLLYNPIAGGRTYTPQFRTNLVSGAWATLTGISGPVTNITQVTVTDTNAVQPQKFYRIDISLP